MTMKSFRGKMSDDTDDTIVLHTNNGSMGYRITKFEVCSATPGTTDNMQVFQIFSTPQTTNATTIDFSDQTLLGIGFFSDGVGNADPTEQAVIIFDDRIFNQDIYVTHRCVSGSDSGNYHIELEQIKLDLNENTVATLKDIRNLS